MKICEWNKLVGGNEIFSSKIIEVICYLNGIIYWKVKNNGLGMKVIF